MAGVSVKDPTSCQLVKRELLKAPALQSAEIAKRPCSVHKRQSELDSGLGLSHFQSGKL